MTGAEFAATRARLGYTQGALAALLGVSTPTVCRMEERTEVPREHAERLAALPPAPAQPNGRGAYNRPAAKGTAQRRRAQAARARPTPPPLPPAKPEPKPEPVRAADAGDDLPLLEAEEAGAYLLEVPEGGSPLRGYWERVNACLTLLEWRQRLRAGRPPCPR